MNRRRRQGGIFGWLSVENKPTKRCQEIKNNIYPHKIHFKGLINMQFDFTEMWDQTVSKKTSIVKTFSQFLLFGLKIIIAGAE